MLQAILWAAAGTGFTALMTMLGASTVFFLGTRHSPTLHKTLLGFAAGVMLSAIMFSLLTPAIEMTERAGGCGWIPAAGGSALGIIFLLAMDALLPHITPDSFHLNADNTSSRRGLLMVLAITLHNIPEGMAVAASFALAAQSNDPALLTASLALAAGVGIQNFPEGAAIALPLKQEGMSRTRAFLLGAFSGIVEPIFGVLIVVTVGAAEGLMPWLLSFAAGTMLYVVVEELIPEVSQDNRNHNGTLGVMVGFLLMMILNIVIGS